MCTRVDDVINKNKPSIKTKIFCVQLFCFILENSFKIFSFLGVFYTGRKRGEPCWEKPKLSQ